MNSRWIRTSVGHAGRSGFIARCPKGDSTKFRFVTYDGRCVEFSDSVGELKKFGDSLLTSHPDAELV